MNFCYSKGIVKPFYQWDAFNYSIKYAELLTFIKAKDQSIIKSIQKVKSQRHRLSSQEFDFWINIFIYLFTFYLTVS